MTVNGFSLVTSADSSRVGSSSQREPVGDAGSGIGRNELGSTSERIAAFTGDWSDSRCGLNPAPIESIAMMICVAFGGGGGVLCGGLGALRRRRRADGARRDQHQRRVNATGDAD